MCAPRPIRTNWKWKCTKSNALSVSYTQVNASLFRAVKKRWKIEFERHCARFMLHFHQMIYALQSALPETRTIYWNARSRRCQRFQMWFCCCFNQSPHSLRYTVSGEQTIEYRKNKYYYSRRRHIRGVLLLVSVFTGIAVAVATAPILFAFRELYWITFHSILYTYSPFGWNACSHTRNCKISKFANYTNRATASN